MARAALTVAWLVLLLHGAWRWHTGAVMAPLRVDSAGGPAIVLVTQEGDCPDRLVAAERWLEAAVHGRSQQGGPPDRRVARLGGLEPTERGDRELDPLDPRHARIAGRAFSRFATDGTPGVLVLNESGYAVAGFGFTPDGPDPAWDTMAGIARVSGLAPDAPDSTHSSFIPEDRLWNP